MRGFGFDEPVEESESIIVRPPEPWPPDITTRLGDYLRAVRRHADLSQRELAAKSGVSYSTIERLELDGGRAADARLSTLAKVVRSVGHRLLICDGENVPIEPESEYLSEVRDLGGRRLPAHLDPELAPPAQWRPWWQPRRGPYTYTRSRYWRDEVRRHRNERLAEMRRQADEEQS
jgi:transcriptional regulator with XRE-family HTH domain